MDPIGEGDRLLVRFPAGPAYATVTGVHRDPDFYLLAIAGADGYGCTPEQVVRVLDAQEHHDNLPGADHRVLEYTGPRPWARRPGPYPDLTGHLAALAAQVGYDVDLAELDPTVGFHPREVIRWAAAGAGHATIGYLRHLLADPIAFLREQDPASGLLDRLRDHDRHLAAAHAAAARRYAAACHTLLPTALIWPTHGRPADPPPGHTGPSDPPEPANRTQ